MAGDEFSTGKKFDMTLRSQGAMKYFLSVLAEF